MAINFNNPHDDVVYTGREASQEWKNWAIKTLVPEGRIVADVGCGGGIYSHAFVELGAKKVYGIDASDAYIKKNQENTLYSGSPEFRAGDCGNTGLPGESVELVFQRALIHHLSQSERGKNLQEVRRILCPGGRVVVQDRCIEDVLNDDPRFWIRRTLFKLYPQLIAYEKNRRPERAVYQTLLVNMGFHHITTTSLAEPRKHYKDFQALREEFLQRKGKSILYELEDNEIQQYLDVLEQQASGKELLEIDPWTIWIGKKDD